MNQVKRDAEHSPDDAPIPMQRLELALFEPEIAPNTGNLMRLCVNLPARLHLIEPLGFALDDRRLRRAGLDYRERAVVQRHTDLDAFIELHSPQRWWAFTTRGSVRHSDCSFQWGDVLLFGPETRGLPDAVLDRVPKDRWVRIPQLPEARSLNLANAASVAAYEAWRQLDFAGAVL